MPQEDQPDPSDSSSIFTMNSTTSAATPPAVSSPSPTADTSAMASHAINPPTSTSPRIEPVLPSSIPEAGSRQPAPASSTGSPPHGSTSPLTASMSDPTSTTGKQRTGSMAGKDAAAMAVAAAHKITKRRAARACVSCRARKVRCDVVEGAPCGNCRWDNIECVVQESRRRKKNLSSVNGVPVPARRVSPAEPRQSQSPTTSSNMIHNHQQTPPSLQILLPDPDTSPINSNVAVSAGVSLNTLDINANAPMIASQSADAIDQPIDSTFGSGLYQQSFAHDENMIAARRAWSNLLRQAQNDANTNHMPGSQSSSAALPAFIRPLPAKIGPDEINFLRAKGSLTLPSPKIQSALLQAYAEYVHPFMPLLDLHGFLKGINARNDPRGQISLFLYHCAMFAASAFVDMDHLRECGFTTRKTARKMFFLRARTLYDLDYEADRLILVQGLLLMTFWYESPDDQKDTWHWMGIATSLAHSIGLHRISSLMNVPARKLGLYRRIWWSCFMRDQEIALGMRRPTRIKAGDFNVDMLQESDFDIRPVADDNTIIPRECRLVRDVRMQRDLAEMTIAKAKLCVLVSHMLKIQYSVHTKGTVPMDSASMLFPNKTLDNVDEINEVDARLNRWRAELPESCSNRPLTPFDVEDGKASIAVHRSLLHMIYYTTQSALHRPQFLGMQPAPSHLENNIQHTQEMARIRVRDAATQITRMATDLHELELDRYLPTTGVTIVLPAMIIHMLEMKHQNPQVRDRALRGFKQCMDVMQTLRTCYAAAEYATGFLDAFLHKASIDINIESRSNNTARKNGGVTLADMSHGQSRGQNNGLFSFHTPPPETAPSLAEEIGHGLFGRSSFATDSSLPTTSIDSVMTPIMAQAQAQVQAQAQAQAQAQEGLSAAALAMTSVPAIQTTSLAATSPPHTEHDVDSALGSATPNVGSGASWEDHNMDGTTTGPVAPAFEWSGVSTGEFDVDYWLQFPSEVGATDDAFGGTSASATLGKPGTQQPSVSTAAVSAAAAAALAAMPVTDGSGDTLMWGSDPIVSVVGGMGAGRLGDSMQMDFVSESDMAALAVKEELATA
ncbi:hypothetical protein BROUX41_002153 [Berkeleyomyces rouxiae]|uniref:uncharacterized protein n=1 Tax=Berkeleyomyces rouxiae TaxID=2035830 RepID=UPI003B7D07B9